MSLKEVLGLGIRACTQEKPDLKEWEAKNPHWIIESDIVRGNTTSNPCHSNLHILANGTHASAMSLVHILHLGIQHLQ